MSISALCVAALSTLCVGAETQPQELIARGRSREAVPLLEAQRDTAKKAGRRDLDLVVSLNNLGTAYYELGRFRDAQRAYEESLLLRRRLGDGESRDAARTLSNLGAVYLELRQVAKARVTLEQATRALEFQDPDGLPITGVWVNLATAYKDERRLDEAEALFRKALAARERILGPAHRDVAMALNNLGVLLRDRRQLVDAQAMLERAAEAWEHTLGPDHPQVAAGLHNLGVVYAGRELTSRARECYERALRIAEKSLPPDHPNLAAYRTSYAALLGKLGQKKEAKRLEELARQGLKRSASDNLMGYTVDARRVP
jgi:Tfp pilus assembly protein PilF